MTFLQTFLQTSQQLPLANSPRRHASLALAISGCILIAAPMGAQAIPAQSLPEHPLPSGALVADSASALPSTPLLLALSSPLVLAQDASQPKALHIVILEGEDALNNIRDRTAREPIVQVEDENHKPVAGALVLFTLHGSSGVTGAAPSLTSLSVTTGADGHAIAHGLQINQLTGKITIDVHATSGNLSADTTIHQTNVDSSSSSSTQNPQTVTGTPPAPTISSHAARRGIRYSSFARNLLIISGAAGVAATVVILGSSTSGTVITPGAGVVGH